MKYALLAILLAGCALFDKTPKPDLEACKSEVSAYKQSLDAFFKAEKALKECDK